MGEAAALLGADAPRRVRRGATLASLVSLVLVVLCVTVQRGRSPRVLSLSSSPHFGGHKSVDAESGAHSSAPPAGGAGAPEPTLPTARAVTASEFEARLGRDLHGRPLSEPKEDHAKGNRAGAAGEKGAEHVRPEAEIMRQPPFKDPLARNPTYEGTGDELREALHYNQRAPALIAADRRAAKAFQAQRAAAQRRIPEAHVAVARQQADHSAKSTLTKLGERAFYKYDSKKGAFYSYSPDKGAVAKPGSIADTLTKIRASASAQTAAAHEPARPELKIGSIAATAHRLATAHTPRPAKHWHAAHVLHSYDVPVRAVAARQRPASASRQRSSPPVAAPANRRRPRRLHAPAPAPSSAHARSSLAIIDEQGMSTEASGMARSLVTH